MLFYTANIIVSVETNAVLCKALYIFREMRAGKMKNIVIDWCPVKICTTHYKSIGVKYFWRLLQQRDKETDGR